ncbi:MAG: hypothetical protein NTY17_13925 [Planctomycetia bacterium]|nr:hypothetical protein [Planctomycetia bacterium]
MKRIPVSSRLLAAACLTGRLVATVISLCGTRSMAASSLDDLRPLVVTKTWDAAWRHRPGHLGALTAAAERDVTHSKTHLRECIVCTRS